jgi:hypothetical protein
MRYSAFLFMRALELSVLLPPVLAIPERFSRHNSGTGSYVRVLFPLLDAHQKSL